MRVLVAGHMCLDLIPALADDPGREPGALYAIGPMEVRLGGVVNTGDALAALGVDVSLCAAVGNDSMAFVQRELLARKEMDVSRMIEVDAPTSYSIVLQPPHRDRTFWHHAGANDLFDGDGLDLADMDVVHIGYPNLLPALLPDDGMPLRRLCERAHDGGLVTSVDLAVLPPVAAEERAAHADRWRRFFDATTPAVDILTPSIDDLQSAVAWGLPVTTEGLAEAARRLIDLGAAVVMVTGGGAGLHVATTPDGGRLAGHPLLAHLADTAGENQHLDAAPIERIVGTTGAGDTATAGFLAAVLGGAAVTEAGARATALAARHISGQPLT